MLPPSSLSRRGPRRRRGLRSPSSSSWFWHSRRSPSSTTPPPSSTSAASLPSSSSLSSILRLFAPIVVVVAPDVAVVDIPHMSPSSSLSSILRARAVVVTVVVVTEVLRAMEYSGVFVAAEVLGAGAKAALSQARAARTSASSCARPRNRRRTPGGGAQRILRTRGSINLTWIWSNPAMRSPHRVAGVRGRHGWRGPPERRSPCGGRNIFSRKQWLRRIPGSPEPRQPLERIGSPETMGPGQPMGSPEPIGSPELMGAGRMGSPQPMGSPQLVELGQPIESPRPIRCSLPMVLPTFMRSPGHRPGSGIGTVHGIDTTHELSTALLMARCRRPPSSTAIVRRRCALASEQPAGASASAPSPRNSWRARPSCCFSAPGGSSGLRRPVVSADAFRVASAAVKRLSPRAQARCCPGQEDVDPRRTGFRWMRTAKGYCGWLSDLIGETRFF